MATTRSVPTSRATRVGAAVLVALAATLGVAWLMWGDSHTLVGYGVDSLGARVAGTAVGVALLVASAMVLVILPTQPGVAALAASAGAAWIAGDVIGWLDGPRIVVSLAMVLAPYLVPFLVDLTVRLASRGAPHGAGRVLVVGAYALTTVVSVGNALLRDPFLDPRCWQNCRRDVNLFLLAAEPSVAGAMTPVWWLVAAAVTILAAGLAIRVLSSATVVSWRSSSPALVAAASGALAEAAYALWHLRVPVEGPAHAGYAALYLLRTAALFALAAGLAWWALQQARRTRRMRALTVELADASASGTLEATLARSTGDSELRVLYPLPDGADLVDTEGRVVRGETLDRRHRTSLLRGGEPLALVLHDAHLDGDRGWNEQLGTAARVAVDNERLRAVLLHRRDELLASRVQIVATADRTRRRLERDLHDGAQQRLLAVLAELRLMRDTAGAEPSAKVVERAATQTLEAVRDLRELAAGIFPAVLAESGLGRALDTLADRSPIALEIDDRLATRLPTAVESTGYLVVRSLVDGAAAGGLEHLGISLACERGALVIGVTARADELPAEVRLKVAARAGALGGMVNTRGFLGDAELVVVIPCA